MNLTGSNGDNLGRVEEIYLDNETSKPEWAEVKTGLFGSNISLVPLTAADVTGDGLTVPFGKDMIHGAPHHDPGREISAEDEVELFTYYGIPYSEPSPRPGGRRLHKYVADKTIEQERPLPPTPRETFDPPNSSHHPTS